MKLIKGNDPRLSYGGRLDLDESGRISLIWPGTYLKYGHDGTTMMVRMTYHGREGNFVKVIVDKVPYRDIRLYQGTHDYCLFKFEDHQAREVQIYKRTGILAGEIIIEGLIGDPSKLYKIKEDTLGQIMFIGDSITVGGNIFGECDVNEAWGDHLREDHYYSYGAITARALKLEASTIAICGTGVVYGWNQDGNMPDFVDKLRLTDAIALSPLKEKRPNLVVINLGQNDCKSVFFDKIAFPKEAFIHAYCKMVKDLFSRYNPDHLIMCLGGMSGMDQKDLQEAFNEVYETLRRDEPRVHALRLLSSKRDYHPGPMDHRAMAQELTEYIKEKKLISFRKS